MEENPYKAPVEENARTDNRLPLWAVRAVICLCFLLAVPGALIVLGMIGDFVMSLAARPPA